MSGTVYLKDSNDENLSVNSPASVKVILSLLNSEGNVIATSSPQLIDSLTASPAEGVPFTAEIAGVDAKTIVILVSKDGFSDYARRFEFSPDVNLTATLTELQELTIAPTQVTSISGKALDGFNVSVINSEGTELIVEGDAGVIADLSVSIPQSALPVGTTSVDVSMQAFNPNDPDEAESFPGAYEDSTGNKLLSVAFNYTDVKTDAGVSLQKIAQDTRKSRLIAQKQSGKIISPMQFAKQNSQKSGKALEPVIINRKIPLESCLSLTQLGDANTTQEGFQVPVYTYNPTSGLWDLLGYGTLFDEQGNKVAADQKVFDCATHTYVLEIEATNEIFLSNWWNLDYPLIFKEPIKLCADIELRDEGNKPVTGSMMFLGDDDDLRSFSSETFVTDSNGRVHIEVMSLDDGADLSAIINVYNESFYSAYTSQDITLSTSCNMSKPPVVISLAIPEMCKVEGRVVDTSNLPLANHYIIAADFSEASILYPAFAITDANGDYDLSLQCKQKYQIFDWYALLTSMSELPVDFFVNVNANIDTSEASDNGSLVVMKDLVFVPGKPFAFVGSSENSNTQMSLYVMYTGKDFPLTYNFSLQDENSAVVGQYSGTIKEADFTVDENELGIGVVEIKIDHQLPQTSEYVFYSVIGEIKDSKGDPSKIFGVVLQGDPVSEE